jgi:hypothetical protein
MNVYNVTIESKANVGAGLGYGGGGRSITIVTDTLQSAMSIARTKLKNDEEIAGIYTSAADVLVDYSHATQGN